MAEPRRPRSCTKRPVRVHHDPPRRHHRAGERHALRWTGYRREDLISGRRIQDLLTVPGRIFYETHVAPLLRMQGIVKEVAFDLVLGDGSCAAVLRIPSWSRRRRAGRHPSAPRSWTSPIAGATSASCCSPGAAPSSWRSRERLGRCDPALPRPTGTIQTWNRGAERLFGWTPRRRSAGALGPSSYRRIGGGVRRFPTSCVPDARCGSRQSASIAGHASTSPSPPRPTRSGRGSRGHLVHRARRVRAPPGGAEPPAGGAASGRGHAGRRRRPRGEQPDDGGDGPRRVRAARAREGTPAGEATWRTCAGRPSVPRESASSSWPSAASSCSTLASSTCIRS